MSHPYQLFHEIAHVECATARRFVTQNVAEGIVRFRNIAYPEVEEEYRSHGGSIVPALWDGTTLTSGFTNVMAVLQRLAQPKA